MLSLFFPRAGTLLTLMGLLGLACFSGGCGEFSNGIFQPGETTVEGVLLGSFLPEQAWVSVLGHPDLLADVEDDGHFEIEDVPSGLIVLIASDGERSAARLEITLYKDRRRRVELAMQPGLQIDGQVLLSSGEFQWATVTALDLPIASTEVTSPRGHFDLHALPWGCLDLEFTHPGYTTVVQQICGNSGDRISTVAVLGPIASGTTAACEPCSSGGECSSGLCIPAGAGNDAETMTCAVLCRDDLDCPTAFACQRLSGSQARVCRPADASCQAVRASIERRSCVTDLGCGEAGICMGSTCTLECDTDENCPGGGRCISRGTDPTGTCE